MKKLNIIKIGGNTIDDKIQFEKFLNDFSFLTGPKILVHGGGKLATDLANILGIQQTLIEGRRITNAETLNVTIMVYAGLINKTIVAKLQGLQCNALGFCGADLNLVRSEKRHHPEIDFGFVGDILEDGINTAQIENLINAGITPILSAITHDGYGNLLNTNADTMATKIAVAMSQRYEAALTFCFDKKGVLLNIEDEETCLPELNKKEYLKLKSEKVISKGMIPKLDGAFEALEHGLKTVTICHAKNLLSVKTVPVGSVLKKI